MTSLLRYAPPLQVNPTLLYPGTTGQTFGSSASPYPSTQDLTFVMPSSPMTGQIRFYGGRHVRMIGGTFEPTSGIVYLLTLPSYERRHFRLPGMQQNRQTEAVQLHPGNNHRKQVIGEPEVKRWRHMRATRLQIPIA